MELQRHSMHIIYKDSEGKLVDEKYTPVTLDHYEFISNGQIFFFQNMGLDKVTMMKQGKMVLVRKYIPTKDIVKLDITTTVEFSNQKEKMEIVKRML